jgi:putative endonuclease
MKQYFVYIMSNASRTLYVGVTSDLPRRVYEHRNALLPGFTSRYHITRLVYFEHTTDVRSAISREKEIKGWKRAKKVELIKSVNPTWKDLAEEPGFFLPVG